MRGTDEIRAHSALCEAQSIRDLSIGLAFMPRSDGSCDPYFRSARAHQMVAEVNDELLAEREAHAETRKRLLKIQWKHESHWMQSAAARLAVHIPSGRPINEERERLRQAKQWREVFHRQGRGVPR